MTRRPLFWTVFGALGVAGFVVAVRLFSVALPVVSLDLSMDRSRALEQAAALAERYGWEPAEARSAASFGQVDPEVQTYVELEGGGRDAFVELDRRGVYHPYVWTVRRFAEGRVHESVVRFTPAGEPYGFRLALPEDDPGTGNLDEDSARTLAHSAAEEWGVDLAVYRPLESSQETLPSARLDHSFVFERTDAVVEEARFRLRVEVSGSMVSEVTHFVHVPEAFTQVYQDMRSDNDAIALVSQSIFILIFVLLGAGVGSALLLRQGWIVWRHAVAWGAVTAVLLGLNGVNALPLAWMGYDTAVSAGEFLLQQIAGAGMIALLGTPLLAFFFLAGESLGRRAFPEHLQQWRFWSPEVAASTPALGRTLAAYLLAGLELGYVVLFYLGTSRLDGWWSPADALVQPDLLATFFPWLQAVSISLFAAFWEESVFRAVPIACAALIGARYGRRNAWIWGAIALQAVVFAAGHANYPQQPPYARVVELTLPAFVWGVVYLRFGLVPTVLTHFLYDLSLISIPLFASDAPGVLLDRAVVVAFGLLPIAVVLRARVRHGARPDAPADAYNRAWTRAVAEAPPEAETPAVGDASAGPDAPSSHGAPGAGALALARPWVFALGLLGLLGWGAGRIAESPVRLESNRTQAVAGARTALSAEGVDVEGWRALVSATSARGDAHRYVFEEAGAEAAEALTGSYLPGPQWIVRFVDFSAAPEARVEEHRVHIGPDGTILRRAHTLREASEGATLEVDSARALALAAAAETFGIAATALREVAAEQEARPARRDWNFTFADDAALPNVDGEARVEVSLAGSRVVDTRRLVHVPEGWERAERERSNRRLMAQGGSGVILVLCFGVAVVFAIVVWSRHRLHTRAFVVAGGLVAVAIGGAQANGWPGVESVFSTQQPWGVQAGIAAFGLALAALVGAAALGLAAALAHTWGSDRRTAVADLVGAASLGAALAGVSGGAALLGGLPPLPSYASAASFVAVLAAPLDAVAPFVLMASGLLLLAGLHARARARPLLWSLYAAAVIAVAVLAVPQPLTEGALTWLGGALVAAAVVEGLVRLCVANPALAPGIVGAMGVLNGVEVAWAGAYPGARLGGLLGALVAAGLGYLWVRALRGEAPPALT